MRRSLPILFVAVVLCSLAPAAEAASRSAVLAACNRTAGCGYTKNKDNGDISGCSKQTCFYCPNDGKKQCFGVGRQLPKPGRLPVITSEDVLIAK